jgi:hypothetical protein
VNVWVGSWQARPVSNHYFAIVESSDSRCVGYGEKAHKARTSKAAVGSIRATYFHPAGVASVKPPPPPTTSKLPPTTEGVWGQDEFFKALEADSGPGDEARQIHTHACTNRAVRCLRCQTVLAHGDYDLHVCPASGSTSAAAATTSGTGTSLGGGGLSESLPEPMGASSSSDTSLVVNATHVCKSTDLCWCEKKSMTRPPEHPGLRETREETSTENLTMFPTLDVRAAAKEALGLREAKELLAGQTTAARLKNAFDPASRENIGHGKLHWTTYGDHSGVFSTPQTPAPGHPRPPFALPKKSLATDLILKDVDWKQAEYRHLKGLVIGDSSISLKHNSGSSSSCNNGEPQNWYVERQGKGATTSFRSVFGEPKESIKLNVSKGPLAQV